MLRYSPSGGWPHLRKELLATSLPLLIKSGATRDVLVELIPKMDRGNMGRAGLRVTGYALSGGSVTDVDAVESVSVQDMRESRVKRMDIKEVHPSKSNPRRMTLAIMQEHEYVWHFCQLMLRGAEQCGWVLFYPHERDES